MWKSRITRPHSLSQTLICSVSYVEFIFQANEVASNLWNQSAYVVHEWRSSFRLTSLWGAADSNTFHVLRISTQCHIHSNLSFFQVEGTKTTWNPQISRTVYNSAHPFIHLSEVPLSNFSSLASDLYNFTKLSEAIGNPINLFAILNIPPVFVHTHLKRIDFSSRPWTRHTHSTYRPI